MNSSSPLQTSRLMSRDGQGVAASGEGGAPSVGALSAAHARVIRRCVRLERLQSYIDARGCDRKAQVAGQVLLRFFDDHIPRLRAVEEDELFPALVESMAGSDAACIRDLGRAAAFQHRAIADHWRRLRPELALAAAGQDPRLPPDVVEAFTRHCREHAEGAGAELLHMAARLLPDQQQQIARRLLGL